MIFQHVTLNIDAVPVVKDIIVIYRKIETILIFVSLKRYFSHPEKNEYLTSEPKITMLP